VDSALVIVGVSFRNAPIEIREKFWINESSYAETLGELLQCEAVDEVAVLSTCNRTEFIVWTADASQAANSILRYLTREYDLRLTEWSKFHRHVDNAAMTYLLRLASGLDSLVFGEADIAASVEFAYRAGVQAQSIGRCLEAILMEALAVARRVRTETEIGSILSQNLAVPVELARQIFGDLEKCGLVVFGSGKKSRRIAQLFRDAGMTRVEVMPPNRGQEALNTALNSADLLLTCLPHAGFALQRTHVAEFTRGRERRLVMIDTAVPRNVDPSACDVPGVVLENIDQLNEFVLRNAKQQHNLVVQAEKIISREAAGFLGRVASAQMNPVVADFRSRLWRVCSEELERLNEEYGPFTEEQHEVLNTLAEHVMQRIASSLARTLIDPPNASEQETLTNFLQGLFHVEASAAAAGQGAGRTNSTCVPSEEQE
jgi:glutamyl-tRNA reductase